jgi:Fe2+ transport system protein FeoA
MRTLTRKIRLFSAYALVVLAVSFAMSSAPVLAESKFSITWGKSVQGSGRIVEVQRSVPSFDRIVASDGLRLVLRRSTQQKIVVKTDDNIEPLIEARVEGNTLQLRPQPRASFRSREGVVVTVDYTQLSMIKISDGVNADLDAATGASFQAVAQDGSQLRLPEVSAGEFDLSIKDGARATVGKVSASISQRYRVVDGARLSIDSASGDRIALKVADGASAALRAVDAKTIEVSVADGASADIAGMAQQQNYALSDAASVDALKLQGMAARVRASDGSSLKLGLVKTLDVDVQDGSSVRYSGDPAITQRLRDGSSVRKI